MNIEAYKTSIDTAYATRIAYESDKIANTPNAKDNILQTLKNLHRDATHSRIVEIMFASNVDADYINRQERSTARYNVKSATKVNNIARCIAAAEKLNHYTIACVRSAHNLEANDFLMTHNDAVAAMSASGVRSKDASHDALLVRYVNNVDASTASTQASSSVNALQMYGVLVETRDAANVVCYKLDRSNVNTIALLKYLSLEVETDTQLALL